MNFVTRRHQDQGFVAAVAEGWKDNARKPCKIPGRRRMIFAREIPDPRVGRQFPQFSASSFECKRRAPTNEGCRRWCPVNLDAGLGSREFPAPEMAAKGR
jgi:hypothetical protein